MTNEHSNFCLKKYYQQQEENLHTLFIHIIIFCGKNFGGLEEHFWFEVKIK